MAARCCLTASIVPLTGGTMSAKASKKLSSEDESESSFISEFWNRMAFEDFDDGTKRELLQQLEREVTDSLYENPPDIYQARRLTAKAIFLLRTS